MTPTAIYAFFATNRKYFSLVVLLFLFAFPLAAQKKGGLAKPTTKDSVNKKLLVVSPPDSLKTDTLSLVQKDSVLKNDRKSVILDSLKTTSDMKSKVISRAEDSIVFDVEKQMLYLYGKAGIDYEDMKVTGGVVTVDWKTQNIYVVGTKMNDSLGTVIDNPSFSQGESNYSSTQMSYNFKSKKGRVINARTQEGDGYVLADVVKRNADNSFYGLNGKYTTCNDPLHPHFYIRSKKMKVIPNSKIISGPLNLVIEDFPIPIVIPFGFVPNSKKKDTGIVLPKYGNGQDRGYYLQGLGFFWGKNPHANLLLTADIYTLGGWTLGASSAYKVRTQMNGNFSFDYGIARFHEATDPDFQKKTSWRLGWQHQQGINQFTNLSASVSFDKSFNRNLNTSVNQALQNNQNSSISFNKSRIANLPISLNLSANARQDINRKTVSFTLPELSIMVGQQTPFKNIPSTKKIFDPLKQLGFSYSLNATNTVSDMNQNMIAAVFQNPSKQFIYTTNYGGNVDTVKKFGYEFFQSSMKHSIPISTKVRLFKYVNINGNFNFNEYWYMKTVQKVWDATNLVATNNTIRGFAAARDFNLSTSANTTFYFLYGLKHNKRDFTVRQVFIPSVGYSYHPDFSTSQYGYFNEYYNTKTQRSVKYSRFEGLGSGPSAGESQSINFGVQSSLEAKLRKKDSFKPDFPEKDEKYERFRILDNIGLNGSYNFAADSFKLSDIGMSARASVFKNKLNINYNGSFSPYDVDSIRKLKDFMIHTQGRLGRISTSGLSFSTSFQSKKGKNKAIKKSLGFDENEYQNIQRYMDGYVDFNIPWTVSVNYNLNYSRPTLKKATIINILNVNGDLNLTPKWKIGFNTGYDFKRKGVSENTSFSVFRDLHCWELSFNWVPLGRFQQYNFTLNVKSSTLQDLKLNRQRQWQNRFRDL